ncbi:acyl-CoA dehydrogenase [Actinomadura rudentiformis]|uniref:Acyl-CoA dehydrogenase n=2 Tax=Actinomadura rudentiformis TaxID=359158 RepID=A0A6H9YQZ9_9ACTN|nr:acyl-CoA dehydrogenase [Actinomadura rudentiformis]
MRFAPTDEQRDFARALDDLLGVAAVPHIARLWAEGHHAAGLHLWRRLAGLGVTALAVPEEHGGLDAAPADLVVAFEALGRYPVPGPAIESVVLAPTLLAAVPDGPAPEDLAEGKILVTVAAPPMTPYALDADMTDAVLLLEGTTLRAATPGRRLESVDRSRRLFETVPGPTLVRLEPDTVATALATAALTCAAQLLGAGEHALAVTVEYVKSRRQFGRVIGEYQAIKHLLADVRVALDFARPLVHGAAVSLGAGSTDARRDVAAAKVSASEAAYRASRAALQAHGAIGYTEEYDLSLWITKIRALVSAWGTPAHHRAELLAALTTGRPTHASDL